MAGYLIRWAAAVCTAVVIFATLREAGLNTFTSRETEGLNTLILLMGSIYAVMFAFVIFVIWGQFTEVETLAAREASSLHDLLRFSQYIHPDSQRSIRRSIGEYTRLVLNSEWQSLGLQQKDAEAEKAFSKLVTAVIQVAPATPAEEVVYKQLVDIVRKAAEWRDERVEKSLARIPPTLMLLVRGMALAITLLLLTYPFHHPGVGAFCIALIGSVLFFADVVMIDTDNPFNGLYNIDAHAFSDLNV